MMRNKPDYDTLTLDDLRAEVRARMRASGLPDVLDFGLDERIWLVVEGHVPLAWARLAMLAYSYAVDTCDTYDPVDLRHSWLRPTGEMSEETDPEEEVVEECSATDPGARPVTIGDPGCHDLDDLDADDLREFLRALDDYHSLDTKQGRLVLQDPALPDEVCEITGEPVSLDEAEALITSGRAE
jgi:hypothetical protein